MLIKSGNMETTTTKNIRVKKADRHPLDHTFETVEEAAQAKTDYVWNSVLKNVDWDKFEEMRRNKK